MIGWWRRWPPSAWMRPWRSDASINSAAACMRRVVLAGLLARSPRLGHPRRADRRAGRGESAWAATTSGRTSAPGGADRGRDLPRLLGSRRPVSTHPASAGRRVGADTNRDGRQAMTADADAPRTTTTRRQRKPVVLLRPVPGDSVIHRLWAGSKLLLVAAIGVLMTFYPGWVPIGAVAVRVLTAAWIARIPRGTLPSIPGWLWVLLFLGGLTATFARRQPRHRFRLGRGRARRPVQFPAHHRAVDRPARPRSDGVVDDQCRRNRPREPTLGRPLRRLRIPVDEWAVALALALRAFPMLIDEFRVLFAARRLRPKDVAITRRARHRRRRALEVIDLLAAAITVALRRADEMGDAITARGGAGQISAAPRPHGDRLVGLRDRRRGVRRSVCA